MCDGDELHLEFGGAIALLMACFGRGGGSGRRGTFLGLAQHVAAQGGDQSGRR